MNSPAPPLWFVRSFVHSSVCGVVQCSLLPSTPSFLPSSFLYRIINWKKTNWRERKGDSRRQQFNSFWIFCLLPSSEQSFSFFISPTSSHVASRLWNDHTHEMIRISDAARYFFSFLFFVAPVAVLLQLQEEGTWECPREEEGRRPFFDRQGI